MEIFPLLTYKVIPWNVDTGTSNMAAAVDIDDEGEGWGDSDLVLEEGNSRLLWWTNQKCSSCIKGKLKATTIILG